MKITIQILILRIVNIEVCIVLDPDLVPSLRLYLEGAGRNCCSLYHSLESITFRDLRHLSYQFLP